MERSATDVSTVPYLPDSAPFTPEQRAYLNGFLAGLFARCPAPATQNSAAPTEPPLAPLTILFGSQTGNAEALAKKAAREAGKRGFAPTIHDLARFTPAMLASEKRVLILTSTYGDGDPPDNAKEFWNRLRDQSAPNLSETSFAVLALGDSNYPKFCGFGRDLDSRLEALGAKRVLTRTDCDLEFDDAFSKWIDAALHSIGASPIKSSAPVITESSAQVQTTNATEWSRSNPFPAVLATNRVLNGPGSHKETRHFEFDIAGSGLRYAPGDVLGVLPSNCPDLVREILAALRFSGDEMVSDRTGANVPISTALLSDYDITRIPDAFLTAIADRSGDESLKSLTGQRVNGELKAFLHGREIIDLLLAHPSAKFSPVEFVSLLKKLQPRLYSISSSPRAFPDQVHLTVNVVRYESLGRSRKGICSTYLADRARSHARVRVFLHSNKNFRLPANSDTPIIMVGPGTGIAPFRAFLNERRASGARGKNWLFFGDQHAATDFLYRQELEELVRDKSLTHLHTAFSRDQTDKVYVQHRLLEHGREIFNWLEDGAHFYVCGDAARMAKDVDSALHEIVRSARGCPASDAVEYIARLKADRRYQRDVY